ncbi:MAG: acetyltransferase [Bacteroidetes bacterium HGW-Bacteroidetes-4]|jgi:sugar O-acyltransferase (sialic acid O-acetyltransferase NeuD family)|nr:MAG: acetyltransferase [Bacteroidetes bacterium HGW-Bacteroidetes-4]
MKEKIILVGGGMHCESCIDVIEQLGTFNILGIIDKIENKGKTVLGYPIIGTDDDLPKYAKECNNFLVTVGQIKDPTVRIKLFNYLKTLNVTLPVIISPQAYVSKHANIGEGSIVLHKVVIDVKSKVGDNCIINHMTTLGHNAQVDDHCHISANCVLGECHIKQGSFVGGNCWINNGVQIPENTIIGSASNVTKTLVETGIYVGNPAKKLN